MEFSTNKALALIVLCACVLGSVFGLGGLSLRAERADALRVFSDGADTSLPTRFSIDAYLSGSAEYARLMAEEYKLRAGKTSITATAVTDLCDALMCETALEARKADYDALCAAVESLYTEFYACVPEADGADFLRAYRNFKSEGNKLDNDIYHSMARKFNASRSGFPAALVAGVVGADALEPF